MSQAPLGWQEGRGRGLGQRLEGWDREWRAGTGNGALECSLLTVLGEEVAVHDLDEAVELLDGQPAHGHVQDELGEQLAAHTGKGKSH